MAKESSLQTKKVVKEEPQNIRKEENRNRDKGSKLSFSDVFKIILYG